MQDNSSGQDILRSTEDSWVLHLEVKVEILWEGDGKFLCSLNLHQQDIGAAEYREEETQQKQLRTGHLSGVNLKEIGWYSLMMWILPLNVGEKMSFLEQLKKRQTFLYIFWYKKHFVP